MTNSRFYIYIVTFHLYYICPAVVLLLRLNASVHYDAWACLTIHIVNDINYNDRCLPFIWCNEGVFECHLFTVDLLVDSSSS